MIFTPTALVGVWILDIEPREDSRGYFARSVCVEEFRHYGLDANFLQQSLSWNPNKGTLRGLHYQKTPYEEDKLVRVTRGSIFDVIVDIRRNSATYGQWFGIELSSENHRQLYVPKGFAHGFQTLQEETEVFYQMTTFFQQNASDGILWSDLALGINWPLPVDSEDRTRISQADACLPLFENLL